MFTPGDFVQPRMGGPKLKVIEVNEDHIVAVQVGLSRYRSVMSRAKN